MHAYHPHRQIYSKAAFLEREASRRHENGERHFMSMSMSSLVSGALIALTGPLVFRTPPQGRAEKREISTFGRHGDPTSEMKKSSPKVLVLRLANY